MRPNRPIRCGRNARPDPGRCGRSGRCGRTGRAGRPAPATRSLASSAQIPDPLHPVQRSRIRCIRCKQAPTGPPRGPLVADPVAILAHGEPERVTSLRQVQVDARTGSEKDPDLRLCARGATGPRPGPHVGPQGRRSPSAARRRVAGPAACTTSRSARCGGVAWQDPRPAPRRGPHAGRRRVAGPAACTSSRSARWAASRGRTRGLHLVAVRTLGGILQARTSPRSSSTAAPRTQTRTYITSNVSATSMLAPPARTGQPLASATAASRSAALRIV